MSSNSYHKHRRNSNGSSTSSSRSTSWSEWKWNADRNQWQSYRSNSRGETEWKFQNDQSASSTSAEDIPRSDNVLPLDPVPEETQYSANQHYTTGNNDVGALTSSLAATNLNSNTNSDPPIAANLAKNNTSIGYNNFDPSESSQWLRDTQILNYDRLQSAQC